MSPNATHKTDKAAVQDAMRKIPAVHLLADAPELAEHTESFGHSAVVQAARSVIDATRTEVLAGGALPDRQTLLTQVRTTLQERPTLYRRVLNATGVVLHTNLGRAPLPEAAWLAMREAAGYCDLELDLTTGKRASRLRGVEGPLTAVTGAEAGMVVNNNAAAVLLALAALAGKRPTAISRGQLVEIGGGFRLPTIVEASGSPLLELGSTNRTHLSDYREALDAGAGAVLLVHRSNFVMSGYVSEPEPQEIIALAHEYDVPVIFDLGSGALVDTEALGMPPETPITEAVRQGFDLVCFSGDKLLGGPQAGLIVGAAEFVEKLRRHPLARALRCDKMQLAAIVATLELYRRQEADRQVPIWSMTRQPVRQRAEAWRDALGVGEVVEAPGAVGGGSLPDAPLPGWALALDSDAPDRLLKTLRCGEHPIVGHIVDDRVLLHPRTIDPEDDALVVAAMRSALAEMSHSG